MIAIVSQLVFVVALGAAAWLISRRVKLIAQTIRLGKDWDSTASPSQRWRNMALMALGQNKMFDKPGIALLHFLIYVGFFLINIEILEIVLDGILGTHRLFAPVLGGLYPALIHFFEFLAVGVIVACIAFILRRTVMNVARFRSAEMTEWPRTDALVILTVEIVLMSLFLTMNTADSLLQERGHAHYPAVGSFWFSGLLKPLMATWSDSALVVYERAAWWLHILGIMGFALYVTYSKHLHIGLAFVNTWFFRQEPAGEIVNMPAVSNEVKLALGLEGADPNLPAPTRFGARDINDLTWKNLLEAYSCTECGRCTQACPANITGKKLSPRKIMMDTRDRLEEVGRSLATNGAGLEDGKALYGDYISKEEVMACTTCNACVEACPVQISPLEIIVELRRYVAMEESATPASWNSMFANVENNQAPWAFPAADRANWVPQQS